MVIYKNTYIKHVCVCVEHLDLNTPLAESDSLSHMQLYHIIIS